MKVCVVPFNIKSKGLANNDVICPRNYETYLLSNCQVSSQNFSYITYATYGLIKLSIKSPIVLVHLYDRDNKD